MLGSCCQVTILQGLDYKNMTERKILGICRENGNQVYDEPN